jgi:predicted transcriptional regulator
MLEPDEVSAILRLNELGWGSKRIARELGISRNTAKDYLAAGGRPIGSRSGKRRSMARRPGSRSACGSTAAMPM